VVTLNGQPAGRIQNEGGKSRGWMEMPMPRSLLAVDNLIEIRAAGQLGNDRWWQIGIDTATHADGSFYSSDGGKSFTAADLSAPWARTRGISPTTPALRP
jgi:hypothetical protein